MIRRASAGLGVLVAIAAALTLATPGIAAAATCSDSWGADGHSGPWYVGSNQSLHGNTLNISCPGGSTAWRVDYYVWKSGNGSVADPISVVRSGNGSASWNVSRSPIGCSQGWNYYTQVYNELTGGSISKPSDHTNVIC